MAYNKTRHVEAAQKFLHQGKIAQAIAEYQSILKNEPKDQVTLMTVGDLFVRQGETFQALEYFERLAQIFLAEGFVGKAIAIYKKIAKLAPEETRPVERLAELYVQQGVLSEARPIYLQLAELHQRAGRHPQAIALLQKLLEAEPDNVRVHVRLAELSLTTGVPGDAVAAFRAAAEHMERRGQFAEAIKLADRALKTDPDDLPTLSLKARMLAAGNQRSDAIVLLQSLPSLDEGGETSNLLIDMYLESGEKQRAADLAGKIFARDSQHFAPAMRVAATILEGDQPDQALPLLDLVREVTTDAGNHEQLSEALTQAAERLPGRIEPREWLVELYGRISDSFRLPDALTNLADAYEAAGMHERAQEVYARLLDRSPDNDAARRSADRLEAQLGSAPEGPMGIPESSELPEISEQEPVAPTATEPVLDEETQRFVLQSLTDADLFASYGLSQKATDILDGVLQRAPQHAPALERLLDLHLGAGDEQRTAELAAQLQQIHSERGNTAAAERFAELHRRFENSARSAAEKSAPAAGIAQAPQQEFAVPPAEAEAPDESVEAASAAETSDVEEGIVEEIAEEVPAESSVHEVDLSEEWAALVSQFTTDKAPEAAETSWAPEAVADEMPPAEELASVAATSSEPESDPAAEPEPAGTAQAEEFFIEAPPEPIAAELDPSVLIPVEPEPAAEAEQFILDEPSPEYELEFEPLQGSANSDAEALSADDFLKSLSTELASVLPSVVPDLPERALQPEAEESVEPAQEAEEEFTGPLSEVFEEFRAGLEDLGTYGNGEDLETHYNLGIAYREMGLVDEAISEFQKVAKANKKGEAFRYAMQCCTLLGLAFMEKSQPSIAAMWYQRALEIPGLDQESVLALRYDLGVAQELSGDTSAALQSFSQVYGMNIDYRDVAERLAALGKAS